jgi:hypothetical protein
MNEKNLKDTASATMNNVNYSYPYITPGISSSARTVASPTLNVSKDSDRTFITTARNKIDLDEMADLMCILKDRLLILTPDFEKHKHYPALKAAYDNYKLLEALCQEENNSAAEPKETAAYVPLMTFNAFPVKDT